MLARLCKRKDASNPMPQPAPWAAYYGKQFQIGLLERIEASEGLSKKRRVVEGPTSDAEGEGAAKAEGKAELERKETPEQDGHKGDAPSDAGGDGDDREDDGHGDASSKATDYDAASDGDASAECHYKQFSSYAYYPTAAMCHAILNSMRLVDTDLPNPSKDLTTIMLQASEALSCHAEAIRSRHGDGFFPWRHADSFSRPETGTSVRFLAHRLERGPQNAEDIAEATWNAAREERLVQEYGPDMAPRGGPRHSIVERSGEAFIKTESVSAAAGGAPDEAEPDIQLELSPEEAAIAADPMMQEILQLERTFEERHQRSMLFSERGHGQRVILLPMAKRRPRAASAPSSPSGSAASQPR